MIQRNVAFFQILRAFHKIRKSSFPPRYMATSGVTSSAGGIVAIEGFLYCSDNNDQTFG